ncbi:MAG TPA: copper resistance protein [Rhodospirillaceae bacterium]|nr:copper resistance protein [Rhodospirillaceae bacterium]
MPLGLHFKLKPGWKIYWRSPGDAGLPPRVSWKGSENVAKASIQWPAPTRFSVLGLETLGYKKEVILPLDVALKGPGSASVKLKLDYLVCDDVCIPYRSKLSLAVPDGPAKASSISNMLARYRAQVPGRDGRHGLTLDGAQYRRLKKGIEIVMAARGRDAFVAPDVFLEGPEGSYFDRPKVSFDDDRKRAELRIKAGGAKPEAFEKHGLIATLVDGERSVEAELPVKPGAGLVGSVLGGDSGGAAPSLLTMLFLALLGGLILNIMPCVLPVLSIKLLGVIGKSGKDKATIRAGFLASAAGIVFSFLVLAAFLIALKAGGMAVGWGIQFQQPVFLAFLSVVLGLFAYNLFGLFEVVTPAWVGNMFAGRADKENLGGHFLSGALATLVATPCSAPFLGTAVGFALSRGWLEIVLVFVFLGIGLALPYLLVAVFPALAGRLPRPGPWMNVLRQILGVALVATVAWLLYVVANVIGVDGALLLSAFLLLIGAVLWLRRVPTSALGRHATKVVVGLSLAAVLFPATWASSPGDSRAKEFAGVWQKFDRAEIRNLVSEGKTVLVDVTADWCVTCQVNKKLVLEVGTVGAKLKSGEIVAMRADWTRPSQKIADYLAGFGRYGIPFNVVYGPKRPDGVPLPEILTTNWVLQAVDQAADRTVAGK